MDYLPGGLLTGSVTFNACFHDLPMGLQTHVIAPAGLNIKEKWTLAGTLPGEPTQPMELGLGLPMQGLYLREDVDMKSNVLTTSIVKRNLKDSHAKLVEKLIAKATEEQGLSAQQLQSRDSRNDTSGIGSSSYAQALAQQIQIPHREQDRSLTNSMPDSRWAEGQIDVERGDPSAGGLDFDTLDPNRSDYVNKPVNPTLCPPPLALRIRSTSSSAPQASTSSIRPKPLPSPLSINIPHGHTTPPEFRTEGSLRPGVTGHQRSHSSTASCLPATSRPREANRERVSWGMLTTSISPRSASNQPFIPEAHHHLNSDQQQAEEATPGYTPFSFPLPQSTIPSTPPPEQDLHIPPTHTIPPAQKSPDTTFQISIPTITTEDQTHSSEWTHQASHVHISQARFEEIARIELQRRRERDRSREEKERNQRGGERGLYDEYMPRGEGLRRLEGDVHPALRIGRRGDDRGEVRSRSVEVGRRVEREKEREREGIREWLDLGREHGHVHGHGQGKGKSKAKAYVRHGSAERGGPVKVGGAMELE